jgi:hypothetical protein
LEIAENTWKIDPRDRMGLLLACCRNCIGAAGVVPIEEETALTVNGRKRKLGLKDFHAFGAALKLTERQIANSFRRFEEGLNTAAALIERGFCSGEMTSRYRKLLTERWRRLGMK